MAIHEQQLLHGALEPDNTYYPETDGRPMGESELHWTAIVEAASALKLYFADDPRVYVGSDLMCYEVRGDPGNSFCPDVFVVFGVPKLPPRRVYKLWEEGKAPDFVLEVTSKATRDEDLGPKRERYARLKVPELVLFDPLGEHLEPRLQGYWLVEEEYVPIEPTRLADGSRSWRSVVLGLELREHGHSLRWWDPRRREELPTLAEAVRRQREAEARAAQAEQRAAALEEELARVRAELERRGREESRAR